MNQFRTRLSVLFGNWVDWVCRYPYRVMIGCALLVLSLMSQMPSLKLDTSPEGFLGRDSPQMIAYDDFREQFGRDDRIIVGIRGDSVFDMDFLKRLRSLHQAIEQELPHLEEVESLINARAIYGTEDELIIEDLFENWPETDSDLKRIADMARENPLYENVMLSEDGTFTMIRIQIRRFAEDLSDEQALDDAYFESDAEQPDTQPVRLLTEEESDVVVVRLEELVKQHNTDDFKIYVAGQPKLTLFLKESMTRDMSFFSMMSVLAIGILLFIIFRTFTAVIPALLVVICSLLSTLGCMAIAGSPIQLPTQILPSFLLAVGVADAVHLMTLFHQQLRKGLEKREALREAAKFAGLPILFTSLTTAGGLLSFTSSDMAPVGALGIFAPIGILFAFFYSMTLLPALIMILPTPRTVQTEEDTLSGRVLVRLGNASINKPWRVIISTVFIAALAIYYSLDIQFTHDPMKWFPEDNSLRVDTAIIDDAMAGSMSLEILIDKGEDYAFHDPTNLKGLEQISEAAEGLSDTVIKAGQSFSLVEVLKEIHKGLNGNQAANYELASERKLISQELLLFENSGSDDLEELVDTVYSKARMTLIVNWDDALHYVTFVDRVKQIALEHFSADEIAITGLMPILSSTFKMVYQSMVNSYAMALIIIIPLVMLIVGSIKIGSLTMAPNLLPILLCLGVMGFMNLPVDAFTMLVGGVSIGLVVDDSIHFLHHFKLFFDQSRSVEKAVSDTLRTTGRALMFTTIVLVCGFCAFAMSSMENLVRFGLLTSMTISLALLADVLLLPAIISLVYSEYKSNNTLKESVAG